MAYTEFVALEQVTTPGSRIASSLVAGLAYQRIKIGISADGQQPQDVHGGNPLPITQVGTADVRLAGAATGISLPVTLPAGNLPVSIAAQAAPVQVVNSPTGNLRVELQGTSATQIEFDQAGTPTVVSAAAPLPVTLTGAGNVSVNLAAQGTNPIRVANQAGQTLAVSGDVDTLTRFLDAAGGNEVEVDPANPLPVTIDTSTTALRVNVVAGGGGAGGGGPVSFEDATGANVLTVRPNRGLPVEIVAGGGTGGGTATDVGVQFADGAGGRTAVAATDPLPVTLGAGALEVDFGGNAQPVTVGGNVASVLRIDDGAGTVVDVDAAHPVPVGIQGTPDVNIASVAAALPVTNPVGGDLRVAVQNFPVVSYDDGSGAAVPVMETAPLPVKTNDLHSGVELRSLDLSATGSIAIKVGEVVSRLEVVLLLNGDKELDADLEAGTGVTVNAMGMDVFTAQARGAAPRIADMMADSAGDFDMHEGGAGTRLTVVRWSLDLPDQPQPSATTIDATVTGAFVAGDTLVARLHAIVRGMP